MLFEIGRKGTLFSFMLYLIYKKNVLCCNSNILCLYCLQFDMYIILRIDSVLLMMNKYSFLLHNYINKKAPRDCLLRLPCVGLPGFEPTIVQTYCFLSKCVAKILSFYVIFQIFFNFFRTYRSIFIIKPLKNKRFVIRS